MTPTPIPPGVTTYALRAGVRALLQAGSVDNFTVAGDCSGTAQTTNGAARPASFEGITGYATDENATLSLSSCTSTVTNSSGVNYYDANFASIGSSSTGGGYNVVAASPLALPETVKVGDAQPTYNIIVAYTDSTKTTRTGKVVEGYSIDADTNAPSSTANTAIYHVTSTAYDARDTVLSTQQTFYRMAPNGTLTLLSLDVLYSGTLFASHLVYTRTP